MQGKGFVTLVAIVLGLICLNELLPSWYVSKIEKEAAAVAGGNTEKYQKEIAKRSKDTLNLFVTELYYSKAKEKEMKLGLDLKGGINVLLEINQRDLVSNLTNYSTNAILIEALDKTDEVQKNSTKNYIDNFFEQFDLVNKQKGANLKLADPEVFGNTNLSEIKYNSTDEEVKKIVRDRIELSIGSAYEVIRTRIDKMGVTQPNVKRMIGTGRISVEMPGEQDVDRAKKMLQSSAKLQFWEVQQLGEVYPYIQQLNTMVQLKSDSIGVAKNINFEKMLSPGFLGETAVGSVKLSDTAVVNKILNSEIAKKARPINLQYTQFMWAYKPESKTPDALALYAIRGNIANKAPVDGAVESANIGYDNLGMVQVDMQMDSKGAKEWKTMTERNKDKPVAITLDGIVYTVPYVRDVIANGRTNISGSFSQQEAQDLVDVLGAGKLPASAKVVQSEVVGPSLGEASINAGLWSFAIAFVLIIVYMILYYGGAGVYAVIAMILNLFYIFGVMDSINAPLTLPGIAGIVLSMGMAIDANVIIYERTKEELFLGKNIKQAYTDGFKHAFSAIFDGHLTTILTGGVLYIFGSGPIKGFAVTLIIGILMAFFTSVILSRAMIFARLEKGKEISVWTPLSKNLFKNISVSFTKKRKMAYIFSIVLTVISLVSIFTNGFKFGIDFEGGRNYIVKLSKPVDAKEAEAKLLPLFKTSNGINQSVEVKTYGNDSQLKITTDYKVDNESIEVDQEVEEKVFQGLKTWLPEGATLKSFKVAKDDQYGIIHSSKVGPTVADDIKVGGTFAVLGALVGIFIYILFRFSRWQFSAGAVLALFHDATIILGAYSLFYKWMPFNMEINQDFIAAILTVVGYSINDTVIIFDRIREYLREKKAMNLEQLFDGAISSTIGRTFNTAFTTLLVLLVIFFFGGDNLKGFIFALLLGIGFGTYSSIFIASAISFDLLKKNILNKENKK